MNACRLCSFGVSRGDGPFGVTLSCSACLNAAREAETLRVKKREERGGTCDSCKKRPAVFQMGHNLTPTGAYRSEHRCAECERARISADIDQAAEAFKRFRSAQNEPEDQIPG